MTKPLYVLGGILLVASLAPSVRAQSILTDGTTNTLVNGGAACSGSCTITGATLSGGNLFHSFQTFNVDTGATVTFDAAGANNIISRVTGAALTTINGTVAVTGGNANLFFFNPNGLSFGPSAQLQLGGSFLGSSASQMVFADGTRFGIADSSATNALLSINTPVGLQTGNTPGSVTVNGSLLTVPLGQTLGLVGGEVTLNGGRLSAPGGRVELGGLGANQTANWVGNGPSFSLTYDPTQAFQDVSLSQGATVRVNGPNAGTIQIQGRQISLTEEAGLLAYTVANGGGEIFIQGAESVQMSGENTRAEVFIVPGAVGDGSSRLVINTPELTLTRGAQLGMGMAGVGASGAVTINAQSIVADGGTPNAFSGIYAAVLPVFAPPASGQGGDLIIQTERLRVSNGAQLLASTFSAGNAGNLTINAQIIEVVGFNPGGPSAILSTSEVPTAATGGPPTLPNGSGNGGTVALNTARLLVADGGQVSTGTRSRNNAGTLAVKASESVELRGQAPNGRSGLFASAQIGSGSGGDINVTTDQLIVRDGATINVSNFPSTTPGPRPGTGPAGNLTATARTMLFDNGAIITADTVAGERANITLQASTLTLNQGSRITTNATGPATGGNISIRADALTALRNSDITANAEDNFGGRVSISSQIVLGTAFRDQLTPASDITATSALGPAFSGIVDINTPEVNSAQTVSEAPDVVDPEPIVAACEQVATNEFVVIGRGGLSADPSQSLQQQVGWIDLRLSAQPDSASAAFSQGQRSASPAVSPASVTSAERPIEAQGWMLDQHNRLVLVASDSGSTSSWPQPLNPACRRTL